MQLQKYTSWNLYHSVCQIGLQFSFEQFSYLLFNICKCRSRERLTLFKCALLFDTHCRLYILASILCIFKEYAVIKCYLRRTPGKSEFKSSINSYYYPFTTEFVSVAVLKQQKCFD